jgi:hypothetical protein
MRTPLHPHAQQQRTGLGSLRPLSPPLPPLPPLPSLESLPSLPWGALLAYCRAALMAFLAVVSPP